MQRSDGIARYTLRPDEVTDLMAKIGELRRLSPNPVDPAFYDRHGQAYQLLPSGLRSFLEQFRRTEPAAACLVHGFPVDDENIGVTPQHWQRADGSESVNSEPGRAESSVEQEIFMAMCGLALGDPFTWSTLQAGAMVQNIIPIRGDEQRQSGHGSEVFLEFHTEDGFHPARCDYLLLFGMRNRDNVPTYVASVRDITLTAEDRAVLSEPRFLIRPDDEHVRQLQRQHPDHPALRRVLQMRDNPEPVPVLFGSALHPYLRVDRPFMNCLDDDPVAECALETLMGELERVRQPVVVDQGSLLIVDNYLAVHGRKAGTTELIVG
jgi:L-asparagine oxygenase